MVIHTFQQTQIIDAPLAECWNFFSNPGNLVRITPPALGIEVITDTGDRVYAGLLIQYRVRPLFGIPMNWLTEITHVEERRRFVDEQRAGPYRLWHHEHNFSELDRSRTEVKDVVHYVLPFSPLSEVFHRWLVEPELHKIFAYRERETTAIFSGTSKSTHSE